MKCHNCGGEISSGARFCSVCGVAVKRVAEVEYPNENPVPSGTICPNCGNVSQIVTKYCVLCGGLLPDKEAVFLSDTTQIRETKADAFSTDEAYKETPEGVDTQTIDNELPVNSFIHEPSEDALDEPSDKAITVVEAPDGIIPIVGDIYTEGRIIDARKSSVACYVAIAILSIIAVSVIGCFIYLSSDSYSVKVATDYIKHNEYDEAYSTLEDIHSEEADNLRRYIQLEEDKETFLNSLFETSDFDTFDSAIETFGKELEKFEYHTDVYSIDKLFYDRFRLYNYAVNSYEKYQITSGDTDLYSTVYGVQRIYEATVKRRRSGGWENNGQSFTLAEIQEMIDSARSYFNKLDSFKVSELGVYDDNLIRLWNDVGYSVSDEPVILLDDYASTVEALYSDISSELDWYDDYMESSLEEFNLYDDLYSKNYDPSYTATVGVSSLKNVSGWEDVSKNARTVDIMFNREVIYYIINHKVK